MLSRYLVPRQSTQAVYRSSLVRTFQPKAHWNPDGLGLGCYKAWSSPSRHN